jgi:hypothetical protein
MEQGSLCSTVDDPTRPSMPGLRACFASHQEEGYAAEPQAATRKPQGGQAAGYEE